jgi:large subunit ribosomal protein L25
MRTDSGKGAARRLREEGLIPGVIYGMKKDVTPVKLSAHDVMMIAKQGNFYSSVLDIELDGKKEQVLPRELQRHPVTGQYLHLDMLRFDANRRIVIEVPVSIIDEDKAPGIKEGGVLQTVRNVIEVRCLASKIPSEIEISVEGFGIGDSVHFSSVKLPEGVELTTEEDFTIASIVAVRQEAEEDEDGLEAAAEGEEGEASEGGEEASGDAEEAKSEE